MTRATIRARDRRLALSHLIRPPDLGQGLLCALLAAFPALVPGRAEERLSEASRSRECNEVTRLPKKRPLLPRGLHYAALILTHKVVTVREVIWPGSSERGHFIAALNSRMPSGWLCGYMTT